MYSIWDPMGNITAIVEKDTPAEEMPGTAKEIMERHPEVEQVGFFTARKHAGKEEISLNMAGGEFCGNASMCAGALYLTRQGRTVKGHEEDVTLKVSGTDEPVTISLKAADQGFETSIIMPKALSTGEKTFSFDNKTGIIPVIELPGITHLIIEEDNVFFSLSKDEKAAVSAVRGWCGELDADGLGLMFIEGKGTECRMTPLVYVPVGDTVFFESSCASGSAAAGIYRAYSSKTGQSMDLKQPGGTLKVKSDPESGKTILYGKVRHISTHNIRRGGM